MLSSPLADGTRAMLDPIPEGFDVENWASHQLSDSTKAPSDSAFQADEDEKFTEIRTRMRRETTETLISNLVSLKPPVSVADSRLIEIGILNEVAIGCNSSLLTSYGVAGLVKGQNEAWRSHIAH